jgi:hypothetical protein
MLPRPKSLCRLLLWAPLLAGCHTVPPAPFVALAAIDAASVTVLGRSVGDVVVSAATGRNCSVVRLDRGESYCKPIEPPPPPPEYCTRSLARVDCWIDPEALSPPQREVADGPRTLTPLQEERRVAPWPSLF